MSKWTLEEEQELIDLRYEGIPIIEVAQALGRTVDSVRKKHWKLMHEYGTPQWFKKIEHLGEENE
jgi:hypothetical protein